jgi:crotonobetainyl-CoA:carnitine CoA-transferase CaiB-like acyl-CoA transferase
MMSLTGRPEDPPTFCGASINDKATGMFCVIGALAALRQRDRTGRGCLVDTSLFETAVHWVEGPLNAYLADGQAPKRHGTGGAVIVPYQVFETADRPLCLAAGNDRLWARCARVLGYPEWGTDPRFATGPQRVRNKGELIPLIQAALRERTRAEWLGALAAAGVPSGPVNDVAELAATEQLAAVGILQDLPEGGPRVVGLPVSFDRKRPLSARRAPRLGEHNRQVLGRP